LDLRERKVTGSLRELYNTEFDNLSSPPCIIRAGHVVHMGER